MNSTKRKAYKSMTRKGEGGTRPCDGKMATSEPGLLLDVIDLLKEYDGYMRDVKLYDAVNLLLGLDRYVEDKKSNLARGGRPAKASQNFEREKGRIVTVELFGHFDKELTYEHPCIVLAGGWGWAVVAPISSTKYGDGEDTHIDLDPPLMSNKCGIMLENLRYVSEKRILDRRKRLTAATTTATDPNYGKKKLAEIDDKLAQLLLPYTYNGYKKNEEDLIKTQKDLEDALNENDEKEKKLKEQEELIQKLEDTIRRLEAEKEITV
ncbi:type II toxin-antitoxin system PemK/MazF family toxin [Bacillus cereus]|uniref:type II toxin-antitoxin system PemK/MazF family toxin n=1 Tax=Bacillus cereus TaxID=1396 RepID=UPI000B4B3190|nr:type II toxin-antitoxin system PemK/MazF family toxin [Bacillus cereus]